MFFIRLNSALPTLKYVVVIPFLPDYSMDLHEIPNSLTIEKFLSLPGEIIPALQFEQVPFNHPLFIISIPRLVKSFL